MAKHIVFLVHGMGIYSKKNDSGEWEPDDSLWHDAQKKLLSELLN